MKRGKGKVKSIRVDIDNPSTWVKYKRGMCDSCVANCCRMPVEARVEDLVRLGVVDEWEAEGSLKKVGERLVSEGVLDRFNVRQGVFVLARRGNLDCRYLDAVSRRCTVYEKRPAVCRSHPQVGPKAGFCAYEEK